MKKVKGWLFEKTNKIDKLQARLIKKKIEHKSSISGIKGMLSL